MSPAPRSTLSINTSRKKSYPQIFSPGKFLIGIVFAASLLLALSVYLTTQLHGQSSTTSHAASSSSSNVRGEAAAVTSDGDDDAHPVICNELLKDPTIWDPSKLHNTLIFYLLLFFFYLPRPLISYQIPRHNLNIKMNVLTKMR